MPLNDWEKTFDDDGDGYPNSYDEDHPYLLDNDKLLTIDGIKPTNDYEEIFSRKFIGKSGDLIIKLFKEGMDQDLEFRVIEEEHTTKKETELLNEFNFGNMGFVTKHSKTLFIDAENKKPEESPATTTPATDNEDNNNAAPPNGVDEATDPTQNYDGGNSGPQSGESTQAPHNGQDNAGDPTQNYDGGDSGPQSGSGNDNTNTEPDTTPNTNSNSNSNSNSNTNSNNNANSNNNHYGGDENNHGHNDNNNNSGPPSNGQDNASNPTENYDGGNSGPQSGSDNNNSNGNYNGGHHPDSSSSSNNGGGDNGGGGKPVLIDLDGDDEISILAQNESDILFDFDGDGYANSTSWVAANDGLLAYDKDSDGIIKYHDELSFISYDEDAQTDLEGLKHFDTNGDNILDENDAEFDKFHIWQDKNQNGISDEGELRSLKSMGIVSLSLISDGIAYEKDSATIHGETVFTYTDGRTAKGFDASFTLSEESYHLEVYADALRLKTRMSE